MGVGAAFEEFEAVFGEGDGAGEGRVEDEAAKSVICGARNGVERTHLKPRCCLKNIRRP